jgi:hypothetical protein
MSLREKISKAKNLPTESLEIPEWTETVWFRPMTGAQQERLQKFNDANESKVMLRARIVAYTLCEEDGTPIYPDDKDVVEVNKFTGPVLDRLLEVAMRVNLLTPESREELAKN